MLYIVSPLESKMEGLGTRNIHFAEACASRMRVLLLSGNFSHRRKNRIDDATINEYVSSKSEPYERKVFWCPTYKRNISLRRVFANWLIAISMILYVLRRGRRGDKVLFNCIPPEFVFLSGVLKIKGMKLILDVRDIWPDAFPSNRRVIKSLFSAYCGVLYGCAPKPDLIFYVAKSLCNWIERNRMYGVSTMFVPLGYDSKRWVAVPSSAQEFNVIRYVYIGYLEIQCPLDGFIKAIAEVPGVTLDIIGVGSRMKEYMEIAGENVTFHGHLGPDVAANLIGKCDIGVLPFIGDTAMPNKLFDYIGAGLAVFVLGENDSSRFVQENGIGISSDFDAENIANRIRELTREDIFLYTDQCRRIRSSYSKELLYEQAINAIFTI